MAELRSQTELMPKIDPVERLKSWFQQWSELCPKFDLREIGCLKLRKIINKMRPSRSHGTDFIDSFSLKLAYPLIENAILHLVNLSISQNKFSTEWKYQLVLPLHKKKNTLDDRNYRHVAHIITVCKIVEYVVHEQVYSHGFLRHRSTTTALIQLYDLWLTAAENKELSTALLLDLSAAFDIVDHEIFLNPI